MNERPFTVKQLADRWSCSTQWIYDLIAEGRLPCFRLGSMTRIPASAVAAIDPRNLPKATRAPRPRKARTLGEKARRAVEQAAPVTGEVYFAQCERFVKIGYSGYAEYRVKALQCSCPFAITLLGSIPGSITVEKALHRVFKAYHHQYEWFRLTSKLHVEIASLCAPYEVANV